MLKPLILFLLLLSSSVVCWANTSTIPGENHDEHSVTTAKSEESVSNNPEHLPVSEPQTNQVPAVENLRGSHEEVANPEDLSDQGTKLPIVRQEDELTQDKNDRSDSARQDSPLVQEEVPDQLPSNEEHATDSNDETSPNETESEERMDPEVVTSEEESRSENRSEPLLSEEPSQQEEEENKTASEGLPSYVEWTKQQLLKQQSMGVQTPAPTNGASTNGNGGATIRETKKEDGKNFASPDCGAKVLLANPEAQNPSGILSSSHDEYMLNKCGVSSWVIIELCESMKAEKVAVGNLELFSSSPKEIEIGLSDRYPTRDWVKFGPVELPDGRAIHSIPLNSSAAYNKYLRVQVLNHHGNEHYCPLSTIRIYGKSEFDDLDAEPGHQSAQEVNFEQEGFSEEDLGSGGISDNSVIGSAANVIAQLMSSAAQVLKRGSGSNEDRKMAYDCQSTADCFEATNFTGNATEICNNKVLYFVQQNTRSVMMNSSLCESYLGSYSIGGPSTIEGFWRAIFGDGIWHLMCDYMSPIRNCIPPFANASLTVPPLLVEVAIPKNGNGNATITKSETLTVPVTNGKGPAVAEPQTPVEKPPPPVVEKEPQVAKESVFVRLTNRIKALEVNQSLSSGYLEELSQRFKKQSEDSHNSIQGLKRAFNDSVSKFKFIEDFSRREATYLRRSIIDLRATLWRTEMQRLFLIFVALLQFLTIAIICLWTRSRLHTLEDKCSTYVKALTVKPVNPIKVPPLIRRESLTAIIPRKRSNSHPEVTKIKKKKKKKDIIKNLESDFKLSAAPTPDAEGAKENSSPACFTPPPKAPTAPNSLFFQKPNAPFSFEGANRFQALASPSPSTPHSVENEPPDRVVSGSTSSVDYIGSFVPPATPVSNGVSYSSESLDSESVKLKSSKKMKLKKLIPKLFDSHK